MDGAGGQRWPLLKTADPLFDETLTTGTTGFEYNIHSIVKGANNILKSMTILNQQRKYLTEASEAYNSREHGDIWRTAGEDARVTAMVTAPSQRCESVITSQPSQLVRIQ
jgi:hypothetical protein